MASTEIDDGSIATEVDDIETTLEQDGHFVRYVEEPTTCYQPWDESVRLDGYEEEDDIVPSSIFKRDVLGERVQHVASNCTATAMMHHAIDVTCMPSEAPKEPPWDNYWQTSASYCSTDAACPMKFHWSQLVIRFACPCIYYDLCSGEGRMKYCDLLEEQMLGAELSTWIPYLIVVFLHSRNQVLAMWLACGVSAFICSVDAYYASYRTGYPIFYWLIVGEFLAYFGLGIVVSIEPLKMELVDAVIDTCISFFLLMSILAGVPFTIQYAKPKVPAEIARKPEFMMLHNVLSGFWLFLFVLMAIADWLCYACNFREGSSADIVYAYVVPIVSLTLGIVMMPVLARLVVDKEDIEAAGSTLYASERGRSFPRQITL